MLQYSYFIATYVAMYVSTLLYHIAIVQSLMMENFGEWLANFATMHENAVKTPCMNFQMDHA